MILYRYITLCLSYSSIGCGAPVGTRKEYIDGEAAVDANIKQMPWMVSLGKWEKGSYTLWIHECAGSLITNRHVLTSAHCFANIAFDPNCPPEKDFCDYAPVDLTNPELLR